MQVAFASSVCLACTSKYVRLLKGAGMGASCLYEILVRNRSQLHKESMEVNHLHFSM
jgi:hypothetical protein